MTPEEAYDELSVLYILTTKTRNCTHQDINQFAKNYYGWAELNIRHHRWTYLMAERLVNRCRELAPLALQYQP